MVRFATQHPKSTVRLLVLVVGSTALAGCQPSAPKVPTEKKPNRPAASRQQRTDRGDVLFTTVVDQLRDLASYIDTELLPPEVVLDAKSSSDGQDVYAVCSIMPGVEDGPINCITVQTQNGRFRSLGVRPGDVIKYYVLYDEDSAETGISQTVSTDLNVAQVLNDNQLLFEGGLAVPITEPAKIEIWRYSDERLNDIARDIATYVRYRQPVFDWQPSPDKRVLKQIVERLNQWMRQSPPKIEWTADPLVASMDPALANDKRLAPLIALAALEDSVVKPEEGRLLQEAVWHRDIGRWAQGESYSEVERATALFDWVVRNIQLDADQTALPYRPWETLVYGHGTAEQRAWVFALLARQQGLDVVVLETTAGDRPQFWLPALVSDGKLYLFDTRLGLPVPGKDGNGVATLEAVLADETLLRKLDLPDEKYPMTTEQLNKLTANVVADPFSISRRAAAIESKLSGDDRLVLTVNPTRLAEKLKTIPGIAATKIWDFPFRTIRTSLRIPNTREEAERLASAGEIDFTAWRSQLAEEFEPFAWRPILWKARALHFQAHREGDVDSPTAHLDETIDDQREAISLYTSPITRPPERILANLASEPKRKIYSAAKDAASYWVGLLLYDLGRFGSAADWFRDPRLAASPNGKWATGTRYNLGRAYEAQGKAAEAAALYEADTSPQRHGNRLRARQITREPTSREPTNEAAKT